MTKRPWTKAEVKALLKTMSDHTSIQGAVRAHNAVWKTGRTVASADMQTRRAGYGGYGLLLKAPPNGLAELPLADRVKDLVTYLKKRPAASNRDVCDRLDISPKRLEELVEAAHRAGYTEIEAPTRDSLALNVKAPPIDRLTVHRLPIEPVKDDLVFAVASDIHFASKLHRRECLTDFLNIAYHDYGVRHVMNPGDIVAGMNMYRGQQNEVTSLAMEQQVGEAVEGLPRLKGLTYHMIGGNHDESFMKSAGANVTKTIAAQRPDVKDYGFYSALVDLVAPGAKHGIKIELHHPDKAGAYAITYHIQKEIEQIPAGMKPHILLCGHTHQSAYLPDYRGVAGLYCGTFEDQTLFLKRKHIAPHIGGWIIRCGITASGAMKTFTPQWVRYFHSRRGALEVSAEGETVRMDRSMGAPVGDGLK